MAEQKEQLKIEAALDTSKVKEGAKQGFAEIQKEEKKVQQESRQTSKAVDDIGAAGKNAGQSMQQAGQQASSALKSMGSEAKATAAQVENIAKAAKGIKLQQGLGVVNRAVSELAPVGQMLARGAGVSDASTQLLGSAISGASAGAMAGAALGPLGAAGGALIGAAASLTNAAGELKKSATEQRQSAQGRYEAAVKGVDDAANAKAWQERLKGYASQLGGGVDVATDARNRKKIQREVARYQTENSGLQAEIDSTRMETDRRSLDIGARYGGRDRQERLAQLFREAAEKIESAMARQRENDAKIASLSGLLNIRGPEAGAEGDGGAGNAEPVKAGAEKAPDNREQVSELSRRLSDTERLGGRQLSDALTKVGGGSGYAGQMNGISSNVTRITNTLKSMLDELKKLNEGPQEGVFVGA